MPYEKLTLRDVELLSEKFKDPDNVEESLYTSSIKFGLEEHSVGLHHLVVDCLWYNIEKRPTLELLRERIKVGIEQLEGYSYNVRKRKLGSEHASAVLASDKNGQSFEEYDIGKKYRPKRKNPRIELDLGSPTNSEYGGFSMIGKRRTQNQLCQVRMS